MRILIINGSPKGEYSITLQTVLYLQKKFPEHEYNILHAGQKIRSLEKDFTPAKEAMEAADLLLFAYPVYTFVATSQLHRFIELTKASGAALSGKYTTQITTSKHFYDVTAHRYVEENCHDLGLRVIRGLSADMDDLLCEKGREEAEKFFRYVCWCMEKGHTEPAPEPFPAHIPQPVTVPASAETGKPASSVNDKPTVDRNVKPTSAVNGNDTNARPGDVVIVTDCEPGTNLAAMIERFCAVLPYAVRVVNLREFPFQGGCLGCFRCAVSGKCVYKDGFDDFLRNSIQTARSIVYAFTIRDHSMGALFKMYDDRQFCNGHRTVTMGMPVGYLVSGAYRREANLQMILEGRSQVGGNFLAGVATDETDPDAAIDRLAETLSWALENKYVPPQNFYGIGGMKIFRDLIWLMQGMMRADHKFYKAHGQYDFPQKNWPTMLKMYAVGALLANPKVLAKMGNRMNEGMLMPYRKINP